MIKKLRYLQASNILQIEVELKKSHNKILRINVYFWETAYLLYPSPNLTLTVISRFGQNVRFGEG